MNLTSKQWMCITMAVLGVLAASTGQMTEFLGPGAAKGVASGASFVNSILAAILAVITGQTSTVREVQAMPGIESITVNGRANSALASLAVDPSQDKIAPARGAETAVVQAASGP